MARHSAPRPVRASRRRRPLLVILLTLGMLGVASAAFAYWVTSGVGAGSAKVGTLTPPTGVTANATPGSSTVSVSWTASAGAPTPSGYFVQRTSTSNGAASPACLTSPTTLTTSTSCSDASVADGTYTYAVTAVYRSWTARSAPSSSVTVLGTHLTTTALASSVNPSLVGQSVTYTATVSATGGTPTGSVTFQDAGSGITCTGGNQTLNAGTATCIVNYASAGSHTITASYSGAAGFAASTSSGLSQVVNRATTATALTSATNPSVVGQLVTLTATVTSASGTPSGTVSFTDGGNAITCTAGNQTLSAGSATCGIAFASAGTHSVVATYGGATAFAPSTSSALSQSVNKAATTTSLASSANPSTTGQAVVLTVTVAAVSPGGGTPAGTVDVKDGSTTICSGLTLSAGGASCTTSTLSVGTHTLTAVYAGNLDYNQSTSATVSQVVNTPTSVTALTLGNKTGGTPGRAEQGDVVSMTFSRGLQVASVYSGWTGDSSNQSLNTATVSISGASPNVLSVTTSTGTLRIGTVNLGTTGYATSSGGSAKPLVFNNSIVTYNPTTKMITITLGQQSTSSNNGDPGTVSSSVATLSLDPAIRDVNSAAISPLTFATGNAPQF